MTDKASIKEIFESVQGEGPYIGYKQLFIRFCGCNLDCNYCDTDFSVSKDCKFYTPEALAYVVKEHSLCHSVSLTGGEPLLNISFLKDFLPICPLPVYLETNATLSGSLSEIINYVDYIAADIKLPSATGLPAMWDEHDAFFEICVAKERFAKIVFNKHITKQEISQCCLLAAKHRLEIILQPQTEKDINKIDYDFCIDTFNKFLKKYKKVRLIPQVHKYMNLK